MLVGCGHCGREIFVLHRRGGQSTATCKWCQAELLVSPEGQVEVLNVPEGAPPPTPAEPPPPVDPAKPTERDLALGTAMITPEEGMPSLPPPVPEGALEERRSEFMGPRESEAPWLAAPAVEMRSEEKNDAGVVSQIYGPLPVFDDGLGDGDYEDEDDEPSYEEDSEAGDEHLGHDTDEVDSIVPQSTGDETEVPTLGAEPEPEAGLWERPSRAEPQRAVIHSPVYEEADTEKVELDSKDPSVPFSETPEMDLDAKTERVDVPAPEPEIDLDAKTERVPPRVMENVVENVAAAGEEPAPDEPEMDLNAKTEPFAPQQLIPSSPSAEVADVEDPGAREVATSAEAENSQESDADQVPEASSVAAIEIPGAPEEMPSSDLDVETDRVRPRDPVLDAETDKVSPRPKRSSLGRNRDELLDLPAPPGIQSTHRRRGGASGRPTDESKGLGMPTGIGIALGALVLLGLLTAWAWGTFRGGRKPPKEPWVQVAEDAVGAERPPAPPPARAAPPPAPPLDPESIPKMDSPRERPKDAPRRRGKRRRARQSN